MQSKKASNTIRKGADIPVDVTPDGTMADKGGTSRTPKSKPKKESSDLGSVRHRKPRSVDVLEDNRVTANDPGSRAAHAATGSFAEKASARPSDEQIAKLAYSFWEARGFEHGFAEHDWLRAERELTGKA
jgi:hypothetical protein